MVYWLASITKMETKQIYLFLYFQKIFINKSGMLQLPMEFKDCFSLSFASSEIT